MLMRKLKSLFVLLSSRKYEYLIFRLSPNFFRYYLKLRGMDGQQAYAYLQRVAYDGHSTINPKGLCVGNFEDHEKYPYEFWLLKHFNTTPNSKVALDFGCGIGRMVRRMAAFFKRCDGVDISPVNIEQARRYCSELGNMPIFYVNNGIDLSSIESSSYDFLFSTICLHHIPIHSTRMNIFKEFYRILKSDGAFSVQMIYKENVSDLPHARGTNWALWMDDVTWATGTNGAYDIVIDKASLPVIEEDLHSIGFLDIKFEFAPSPHSPCLYVDNWLFISGRKDEDILVT